MDIALPFLSPFFPPIIKFLAECPSTQDVLKEHWDQGIPLAIIRTDYQSQGRGRQNRTWASDPGDSLLVSIPIFFPYPAPTYLTIVLGLSLAEALAGLGIQNISLKWPNDLLLGGKKLAGILTEKLPPKELAKAHKQDTLLIGLGLNIKTRVFPSELAAKAVSLNLATGRDWMANDLLLAFLKKISENLATVEKSGLSPLKLRWEELSASISKHISFLYHTKVGPTQLEAKIVGLSDQGELLVLLPSGKELALTSEEIFYLDPFYTE